MQDKKNRLSNMELLRIILMIMIIIIHYGNPAMNKPLTQTEGINYYLIHILRSITAVAVNTFIVITGYFLINKNEVKISKVIQLFWITLFYAVVIFTVALITGNETINFETIKTFLRTILDRWFVTIYIILYLLAPYINKMIKYINKNNYRNLIIIILVFFSIWPTFWSKITVYDTGFGIINFIILYLIGGYIKLYHDDFKSVSKSSLIWFVCTIITLIFSFISEDRAWSYNSIFNIISSVALFGIFKSINIKNNKIINKLSTHTFSIYIIHNNKFVENVIYAKILENSQKINPNYLIINCFIVTILVYITCIVIEFIRRLIMQKVVDKQIDKINYKLKV